MSLHLTIHSATDPNGASLGTVDAASELTYRHVAVGIGEGKVKVNRHHTQAALLQQGRYCRVVSDVGTVGAFWLENGPVDLTSDDEEGGEFVTWSGRGSIAILERGRLLEQWYSETGPATDQRGSRNNPGVWYWDGADDDNGLEFYGGVLARAVEEGQYQPGTPLEDVTLWASAANARIEDATGDPWDEVSEEFTVQIGTSALDLVKMITSWGVIVQMREDLKVLAYNRENFGADKSGAFGAGTVRFEVGVNIAAALERRIHDWVRVSHLLVAGADDTFVTVTDPAYPAGKANRWGFISHGETSDEAVLTRLGDESVEARKRQGDVFSFPLPDHGDDPANGLYEPGPEETAGHFWVGDVATLHTGADQYDVSASYFVAAITWTLRDGDDYDVIVELGSDYHWVEGDGPDSHTECCLLAPTPPTQPTAGACTRLYLTNDGSVGTPPTRDAAWEAGTSAIYALDTTPSTSVNGGTDLTLGNTDNDICLYRGTILVSSALAATLAAGGASIDGQIRARARHGIGISEVAQQHISQMVIRVTQGNSATIRGTALSAHSLTASTPATNWAAQATYVNRSFPHPNATQTLTAVAGAAAGDYLIVEVGYRTFNDSGTPHGGGIWVADNAASDLPEDEITATNLNSWFEICTGDIAGDTTSPTVGSGAGSAGTSSVYAPIDHVHEHGLLSDDGTNYQQATQVDYDPAASGLEAANVQEALDELAAGAASSDVVDHVTMGATETFTFTDGSDHEGTLDADLTVTLDGATAGEAAFMSLVLTQDGTGGWDITWPGSVEWPGGVAPTFDTTADAVSIVNLFSYDGGTIWYGFLAGGSSSLSDATPLADSGAGDSGADTEASRSDHVHPASSGTGVGPILISDSHSTPLVFADLLQNEAGDDLLYADI